MSRYISKLPEPIRALAEKRSSEYNLESKEDYLLRAFDFYSTHEGGGFWMSICNYNYSVFYDLYPKKDKLDELIEWMEQAVESCKEQELSFRESEMENAASCSGAMGMAYQLTINKAKEIKGKQYGSANDDSV